MQEKGLTFDSIYSILSLIDWIVKRGFNEKAHCEFADNCEHFGYFRKVNLSTKVP